jgi:hypothetical protein
MARLKRYALIWTTGSNFYGPDQIHFAKGYVRIVAAGSRSNGLHAIQFGRSDLTAVYGRSDLTAVYGRSDLSEGVRSTGS